jgi:hypothetical protein
VGQLVHHGAVDLHRAAPDVERLVEERDAVQRALRRRAGVARGVATAHEVDRGVAKQGPQPRPALEPAELVGELHQRRGHNRELVPAPVLVAVLPDDARLAQHLGERVHIPEGRQLPTVFVDELAAVPEHPMGRIARRLLLPLVARGLGECRRAVRRGAGRGYEMRAQNDQDDQADRELEFPVHRFSLRVLSPF